MRQFRKMATAGLCVVHLPATNAYCMQPPVAVSPAHFQQETTVINFSEEDAQPHVLSESGSTDGQPAHPDKLVTMAVGDVTTIRVGSLPSAVGKTIHFRLHWTEVTERKESCKTIKTRAPKFRDFDIPIDIELGKTIKAVLLQEPGSQKQELLLEPNESKTLRVAVGGTLKLEIAVRGDDVVFARRQLSPDEVKRHVNPLLDELRRSNVENPHLDPKEQFVAPGNIQELEVTVSTRRG